MPFIKKKTIEFLGCVVDRNGVSIKPAHVKIASEWPIPSKKKNLESFLASQIIIASIFHNLRILANRDINSHQNRNLVK